MTTILRLAGWKVEGLRCPDHEVSFLDDAGHVHSVTLIQMPNGTGKTTTLQLLRAVLSGNHPEGEWTEERVRSLRKRRAPDGGGSDDGGSGRFQLQLLHGTRRVTLALSFDFEDGIARYTTTLGSGMKEGFHPPRDLDQFLRPDFVNLFVFDGELAEHLLDHERTDAQTAVEDLFQLRTFERISQRVSEYWEHQTMNKGATEEKGLNRRRNRVAKLRERITLLGRERRDFQRSYDQLSKEIEDKKKRFETGISTHRELSARLQTATQDLVAAQADASRRADALLSALRDPHALSVAFARDMLDLKAGLDRVKLPESTAREFFEELAQEELCVCGRPLDEETRKAVRERAAQYLGSDNVALLNAIKADVAALVQPTAEAHEEELSRTIGALLEAEGRERELTTEKERIEAEVVRLDPHLDEIKSAVDAGELQLEELRRELSKFEDPSETANDEEIFGIAVLEKRLHDAERKLAEVTETIELKKKRDILITLLDRAQANARLGISGDLCRDANDRIARLMPYNTIRIEKVDRCLRLMGQGGGSVGETLSVAYAFLATLFNRTDYQLPFVVDSPANPIDLQVRPKIAELIPALTQQFVAFVISSERQGFVTPLEHACQDGIQYVTLFRKGPPDLQQAAHREGSVVQETLDGVCVYGGRFFNSFHLDEETEARNAL